MLSGDELVGGGKMSLCLMVKRERRGRRGADVSLST